jgi:hypothetical protein
MSNFSSSFTDTKCALTANNDNIAHIDQAQANNFAVYTDAQLANLVENYHKRNATTGPLGDIRDIKREQLRRQFGNDGEYIVAAIQNLCRISADGQTTYKALYKYLYPELQWIGHKSVKIIMRALGAANLYCITNKLPIFTTPVVQSATHELSENAANNIFSMYISLIGHVSETVDLFTLRHAVDSLDVISKAFNGD